MYVRSFLAPPPRVFRLTPASSGTRATAEVPGSSGHELRSVRYARRERGTWANAIVASVLFHALVILLWPAVSIAVEGTRDPGPPPRLVRPIQVIGVRQPSPAPDAPSRRPVVPVDVPAVTLVDAAPMRRGPELVLAELAPPGWAMPAPRPEVAAPAPSSEEGDEYIRPMALSILRDWKPRTQLHGVEITVRVHTSAAGRATGLVELVPPTADPYMNREIASMVRLLRYQPALRGGRPVAAWAEITLIFCHTGVTATSPASASGLADPCAEGSRLASTEPHAP